MRNVTKEQVLEFLQECDGNGFDLRVVDEDSGIVFNLTNVVEVPDENVIDFYFGQEYVPEQKDDS
jgi:hypothetical protein